MIVDDLAARSPWLAAFAASAHIVRVPFAIAAREGDSIWHSAAHLPRGFLPRAPGHLSSAWALPPYERLILVGDNALPAVFALIGAALPGAAQRLLDQLGVWAMELPARAAIDASFIVWTHDQFAVWPSVLVYVGDDWVTSSGQENALMTCANMRPGSATLPLAVPMPGSQIETPTTAQRLAAVEWIGRRVVARTYEINGRPLYPFDTKLERGLDEFLSSRTPQLLDEAVALNAVHTQYLVVAALALLNCRNVVAEPIDPPPALARARARRGQLPLFRYHVLKVRPFAPRPVRAAGGAVHAGEDLVAIHWVRGHFKHYTAARPLLGRHTGAWWWQPHLAGRAPRVVTKSYDVQAPGQGVSE